MKKKTIVLDDDVYLKLREVWAEKIRESTPETKSKDLTFSAILNSILKECFEKK